MAVDEVVVDDVVDEVVDLQVVDELEILFTSNLASDLFDLHRARLSHLNPDFVLFKKC